MGRRISEGTRCLVLEIIETMIAKTGYEYEHTETQYDMYSGSFVDKVTIVNSPIWADDTTDTVFGGLSLSNRRGKIAKRIRTNLFKNYNVRLPAKDISELGNFINENAQAMGEWHYKLSRDLGRYVGQFGDSDACFQDGYQCQTHREAMEVDRNTAIALIYDRYRNNYARAWVHLNDDGAMVFFNAYSRTDYGQLRTRQIAGIVAHDLGMDTRKVRYSTDIHSNTAWAIAVGGNKENNKYDFYFDPEENETCCLHCEEYYHEDYIFWIGDEPVCDDCRYEYYEYCENCGEYHSNDYTYWVGDEAYCEYCHSELFINCEGCSESVAKDSVYHFCGDSYYCSECYSDRVTECESCYSEVWRDDASYHEPTGQYVCFYCHDKLEEELEKEKTEAI